MNTHPPKWSLRFLRWFCRDEYLDEIEGDLIEIFQYQHQQSPARARRAFTWGVIRHFRPEFIRSFRSDYHHNTTAMFRNYLKVGWRNLSKYKMYSAINIGGFALGLATCMLIALYIQHELSYDTQYPDGDRIYRVVGKFGAESRNTYFPAPLSTALTNDFPQIESAGRLLGAELFNTKAKLSRADNPSIAFSEEVIYADQQLLEILHPQLVYGNIKQALNTANTVAISKSRADKYFPGEDPVGKTLLLNNDPTQPYKVGAVFADFPNTSHFQYQVLLTLTGKEFWPGEKTTWRSNIYHTYIKLKPGVDAKELAPKLTAGIVKTYMLAAWLQAGAADAQERAKNVSLELQAVKDIHLRSKGIHDGATHGDIRLVWLFGAVAIFILVIACINFINLSTARSANRAKEVGLRKTVGSVQSDLITQFLTESVLISLLSFLLAMLAAYLLLPWFNELSAKSLRFPWKEWWLFPLIISAAIVIGVAAGIYPSVYLSRFKPSQVLKGNLSMGSRSSSVRSGLVVFQFTTSVVLIIGTMVIYQQLNFILHKDVGFNKSQVILIEGTDALGDQLQGFRNELLNVPDVQYSSASEFLPVTGTKRNGYAFWKKGRKETDPPVGGQQWFVDHDYIKTLGIKLAEGRDFDKNRSGDSDAVIINQSMAKQLGLTDPVGQEIASGNKLLRVIGVMNDFHFESLTENIAPLCLVPGNSNALVSVRATTTDMPKLINSIRNVWNRFLPNETFRYNFLDESYAAMYANIQRTGRILTVFAALAIIIACLGLFALSSFMLQQRAKEISVRLVLGASVASVFQLLISNFLKLVFISLLIAIPIGWWIMHKWLQDYTYRINIGWQVFVIAGVCAMTISLGTVSWQALRAAKARPVDRLRG
jgi:putative ABC transport system permease protein